MGFQDFHIYPIHNLYDFTNIEKKEATISTISSSLFYK